MSQLQDDDYVFRLAFSPAVKYLLDVWRPGVVERLMEVIVGKHKDKMVFVPSDDSQNYKSISSESEFFGTFRLYETNESDISFELYLPEQKQLQISDFVYTNIRAELYIARTFKLKTGSVDVMKMFRVENMGLSFCVLLIIWIATMVALKIFNLEFESFKRNASTNKKSPNETSLFYHYGFMLLQGLPSLVTQSSARLVSISYQFFAFIVVCTIYANIKTELTTNETKFIRNLEELLEKYPGVNVVLFGQDPITYFLQSTTEGILPKLWMRVMDPNSIKVEELDDFEKGMRAIETKGFVAVIESIQAYVVFEMIDELFQKDIQLFISREDLSSIYAMSLRKSLNPGPKHFMRERFFRIVEMGIVQYFNERVMQGKIPQERVFDSVDRLNMEERSDIPLKSFSTAFFVWLGGLALSFMGFLVEITIGMAYKQQLIKTGARVML